MIKITNNSKTSRLVFKEGIFQEVVQVPDRVRVDYRITGKHVQVQLMFQKGTVVNSTKPVPTDVPRKDKEGKEVIVIEDVMTPFTETRYSDYKVVEFAKELGDKVFEYNLSQAHSDAVSQIQGNVEEGFKIACEITQ